MAVVVDLGTEVVSLAASCDKALASTASHAELAQDSEANRASPRIVCNASALTSSTISAAPCSLSTRPTAAPLLHVSNTSDDHLRGLHVRPSTDLRWRKPRLGVGLDAVLAVGQRSARQESLVNWSDDGASVSGGAPDGASRHLIVEGRPAGNIWLGPTRKVH